MAFAPQAIMSSNSLFFFNNHKTRSCNHQYPNKSHLSRTRAASTDDPDCNVEEGAPDKEVGKVSMEWLAGEKTKVVGIFPPRSRRWTGYVEKDTAGQTNIYSIEPTVYVAETAISSGTADSSSDGAENTVAISAGIALITVAAAALLLFQVGKNAPPTIQTIEYSGPSLTYYIYKFKPPGKIIEITVSTEPETVEVVVQTEGAVPEGTSVQGFTDIGQRKWYLGKVPSDLATAIEEGRVGEGMAERYLELEKSAVLRWLLGFPGFRERLLADDLFLAKVAMECGVGIFTKTAAELERRRENFTKELDFVLADVVMAIIADFMLVWLPAPTVSLRPALAISAGPLTKFFYGCPDNAFQVAFAGTSYFFLQRIGAILRNGAKLFVVGTSASLIGTGITNGLINARKAIDKTFEGEAEDVPILSTSVAYGVYMAVSSNLRYQVLAGVIEQRMLEPLLHQHKIALSAICFAVRTGNTFLGSLMWVDYARWVGIQKTRE